MTARPVPAIEERIPLQPAIARLIALVTALIIAGAGVTFTLTRAPEHRATGAFVLAPTATEAADKTNLLNGYERSGAIGTFVELIAAEDTLVRAGRPAIDIAARAVPDTRVIQVIATGDRFEVTAGLRAVMLAAQGSQSTLSDLWTLRVLEGASQPTEGGPSTAVLLVATALLALVGALGVLLALTRLFPKPVPAPAGAVNGHHPDRRARAGTLEGVAGSPGAR